MESTSKQVSPTMSTRYSNASEPWNETAELEMLPYNEAAADQYEQLFIRWSERAERLIRIGIVTLLALLLLSQLLLQWPLFRKTALKVERLEGVPYTQTSDR